MPSHIFISAWILLRKQCLVSAFLVFDLHASCRNKVFGLIRSAEMYDIVNKKGKLFRSESVLGWTHFSGLDIFQTENFLGQTYFSLDIFKDQTYFRQSAKGYAVKTLFKHTLRQQWKKIFDVNSLALKILLKLINIHKIDKHNFWFNTLR